MVEVAMRVIIVVTMVAFAAMMNLNRVAPLNLFISDFQSISFDFADFLLVVFRASAWNICRHTGCELNSFAASWYWRIVSGFVVRFVRWYARFF